MPCSFPCASEELAGAKCLCYLAKKFSHDCDIANSLSIPQKCGLSVPSGFSCAGIVLPQP
ncbi:unnamed protein product [Sphagnum jensenii]|uniref:Bifunctional inhibitor/plant lipid transfer protein/seed storage helical domain-containing protein n=1 Tax=Sphagnum jensenii TaxID=128206 RepID=A0ABP1B6U4_9BRYO